MKIPEALRARYRVERVLGEGGMGQVVCARDLHLERLVAIKLLKVTPDAEVVARFAREARNQGKVSHPHVLQLFDFYSGGKGEPGCLIMDYVEGVDLSVLLQRRGALAVSEVCGVIEQLCAGLDALHEAGILHRDIKPANVMLRGQDRQVVLMDLGLARSQGDTVLTRTGFLGTPYYLPPEVLAGKPWTRAGDFYQVGAVLFELLAGYRLFQGNDLTQLLNAIGYGKVRALPADRKDLSREVRSVVARSIHIDPDQRFPSGGGLAEALRAALKGRGGTRPHSSKSMVARQVSLAGRTWRGPAVLAMVVGGLLVGALSAVLFPGPEPLSFRVVGDTLQVPWASHLPVLGDPPVLKMRDRNLVGKVATMPDGTRVVRFSGLLLTDLIPGRVCWEGGSGPEWLLRGQPPPFQDRFDLVGRHRIRLQVDRPVTFTTPGGRETLLQPGTRVLAWPEGEPLRMLHWREQGVPFFRQIDQAAFHERILRALEKRTSGGAPRELLVAHVPPVEDILSGSPVSVPSESLEADRRPFRELVSWIPELLAGPLKRERKFSLFHLWQTWQTSVLLERLLGGDP
jgi:hypothetical protein